MTIEFANPVSLNHQGKALYLVSGRDEQTQELRYFYNVLNLKVDSLNDDQDWQGYVALSFPKKVSLAGMNILRVERSVTASGYFQAISDSRYVYLIRAADNVLFVNRYLLVEAPNPSIKGESRWELQPAWEVRFQRSQKPDTPLGPKDTQSYIGLEGENFVEPVYELPFGLETGELDLANGWFDVRLLPTADPGVSRWQIIMVNAADGKLYAFSLGRTENGWFDFADGRVSEDRKVILPDCAVQLALDGDELALTGAPTAAVYNKQEATRTADNERLKMQNSYRYLLTAETQVGTTDPITALVTLDFSLSRGGKLAFLGGASETLELALGRVKPSEYTLRFDGASSVLLSPENPLAPQTFTQQLWVYPTEAKLERQYLFGCPQDGEEKNYPPVVYTTNETLVGVGFGNGEKFLRATTSKGVLKLFQWNNVAAVFDGTAYRLFINGDEVELVGDSFAGQKPTTTAMPGLGGGMPGFVGEMDEVRVWQGAQVEAIGKYLYKEIKPDEITQDLLGYWRLDEGSGSVARNLSSYDDRDGTLIGAQWVASSAPVAPATQARTYVDEQGLMLAAGIIEPDKEGRTPLFGAVAPGVRPNLLSSYDGLLHLYYEGSNGEFLVAQYDTTTARAIFGLPWVASAPQPADTQRGDILLAAKQPGGLLNEMAVTFEKTNNTLAKLTIDDRKGNTEQWAGLISRADYITDVLTGNYVADPTDPGLLSGKSVYFDEAGERRAAFHPVGQPEAHGYLLLVARQLRRFVIKEVEIAVASDGLTCDVALVGVIESEAKSPVMFRGSLVDIPTDVSLFVKTLNGASTVYDYGDSRNTPPGSTRFYSAEAQAQKLFVAVPDPVVLSAKITIADATAKKNEKPVPELCDARVELELEGAEPLTASWKNIGRDVASFVEEIKNSTGSKQKAVANHLHFFVAATDPSPLLDNVGCVPQANVLALLSFLDAFAIAPNGSVVSTKIELKASQGLKLEGWAETIRAPAPVPSRKGSAIVSTYLASKSDNGYPAIVEAGAAGTRATLVQPGQDGGWLVESPRHAVAFSNPRSAVTVATNSGSIEQLQMTGSLTQEAWVFPELRKQPSRGEPVVFPRIVHASPAGAAGSRYLLGLSYSSSLQFLRGARVETSDADVPPPMRLFPVPERYSIALYLKADLTTIVDGPGRIFRKSVSDGGGAFEELRLSESGVLSYTVSDGVDDSKTYSFSSTLVDQTWTAVTVVRSDAKIAFYVNGCLDGTLVDAHVPDSATSTILLGGNDEVRGLEMELNAFGVWGRVLDANDVSQQYQRPTMRDDDGLRLLWGMDRFRGDNVIVNTALVTEEYFKSSVTESYFWDYPGVFCRAFAAVRDTAVESRDALVAGSAWSHVAAIYDVHYGVALRDGNFADCGNADALNVQDALSVEAWVRLDGSSAQNQVIFSKFGAETSQQSYEFGLSSDRKPYLRIRVSGLEQENGERERENRHYFEVLAENAIAVDESCFVAATAALEERTTDEGKIYHLLAMSVYINGVQVGTLSRDNLYGSVAINASNAPANIGRTKPGGLPNQQCPLRGEVSDLCLWNTALPASTVASHFAERLISQSDEGIVSFWLFDEQQGRVAFDQKSDNNALFELSDMWITYHDSANYELIINGEVVQTVVSHPSVFGGYEASQLNFGSMRNSAGAFQNPFSGKVDEVRIWSQARTLEQVTDNMERYLTGREKDLQGYWRFDVGTGSVIVDQTGNGNDGRFDAFQPEDYPQWKPSEAPINNEAGEVRNALGGLETPFVVRLSGGPTAVEYADTQFDRSGAALSVLKRAYVYRDDDGVVQHVAGYKIGDLKRFYLGQVQSKPTIVGFVEGTPPMPSENLTRPFYEDPTKPSYLAYYNSTSVKLTQSASGKTTYGTTKNEGSHLNVGLKIGPGYAAEALAGQFVYKKITKIETKFLVSSGINWAENESNGSGIASCVSKSTYNYMYNAGDWEAPDSNGDYYLHNGERRFIPNNEGYALVKSATADMYTLHLENTGTLVGISILPNPDIPEDVNLIYFPINPKYVKNGTLDGKLGLQNDPDYADADVKRQSYFDPIEAYGWQRRIEKREQELRANYVQFNAAQRGKAEDQDMSGVVDGNLLYDWGSGAPKKDMVSTYVWTAAGGLYSESTGYVSQVQESQSGSFDFSWSLGFDASLQLMFGGPGLWSELSLSGGTHWTVTVQKSQEQETALSLDVTADPDGFLSKYLGRDQPNNQYYSAAPVPGKVDSYRFKTFYLAPRKKNFDDFFSEVVDPLWLNTSQDPRAVALREARANDNPAWRVLHRVTFVSRIPPQFEAFPLGTQAPTAEPPVNVDVNEYLFDLIALRLPQPGKQTPAQIGEAVRGVLLEDLAQVVPWWSTFLTAATVVNSPEYQQLNELTVDTIDYVDRYYVSLARA